MHPYKFGILKRRFSCFQGCFKILWSLIQSRTNPNQATRYVIACMCHLAQYWYKQGWHRRFYTRSSSTSRWKREQHRSWRWCQHEIPHFGHIFHLNTVLLQMSCNRSLKRKGDNPFAFSRTKGGNSQSRNFCALLNSFISSPITMQKQKQVS